MKLKTVEVNGQTYAVVQDGKPVFVDDDGKEVAFDAPGTRATISRLNGEAKNHREKAEAAAEQLKKFAGIEDPAKALEALEKLKDIDLKKLVDAGKLEEVKREVAASYEGKLTSMAKSHAEELSKERNEKAAVTNQFHTATIGNAFASSKYIAEKIVIPSDMVQARFGQAFKVEDGKLVAYDPQGNKIYSRSSPAELAGFEEAIENLVQNYPNRDHILKGKGGGSGATGGGGGGNNGGKTMARSEWSRLPPPDQMARMKEGYTLTEQ